MNSKLNILIIDEVHPLLMDRLDALSIEYKYQPEITAEEVSDVLKTYNAVIVRSKMKFTESFLADQPQLELIARAGSGMDNINLDYASKRGIICINAASANADAVGEQTVGMLLALNHRIVKSNREVAKSLWQREANRGVELKRKTVGIIGYGHTGSAVAKKLSSFECRIMAYDKYKTGFGSDFVEEVSYEELLKSADVITFHVPLTLETNQWINADWIATLPHPIALLNLSRGGIMNTQAVIDGIKEGTITAFGADVLENESIKSLTEQQRQELDWLNDQENVIITPHIGGWTKESYEGISSVLADKIEDLLKSRRNKAKANDWSTHIVV